MRAGLMLALALAGALAAAPVAAAPDQTLGPALLSAVVDSDGSLARGAGAVSSARLGTGQYEVIFNRDVRDCTYGATVGSAATGGLAPSAASPARRLGQDNGVFVRVSAGTTGNNIDRPFHLTAFCVR